MPLAPFSAAHAWTLCAKLCPHCPAWLDVVNVLLARPTVINNPTADKPSKTWDGLPQGDPLSTLLFSTVMSDVVSQAVRTITSEVQVVSYVDDTILIGPAEEVDAGSYSDCPSYLAPSGLELQPSQDAGVGAALRVPSPCPLSQRLAC